MQQNYLKKLTVDPNYHIHLIEALTDACYLFWSGHLSPFAGETSAAHQIKLRYLANQTARMSRPFLNQLFVTSFGHACYLTSGWACARVRVLCACVFAVMGVAGSARKRGRICVLL